MQLFAPLCGEELARACCHKTGGVPHNVLFVLLAFLFILLLNVEEQYPE